MDFDGVKGVRKRRTFSSRKPRSAFLDHSSPSQSPPSDPAPLRNGGGGAAGSFEKVPNHGDNGKYSYKDDHDGTRRPGNNGRSRFESTGRAKSSAHRRGGGAGDDDDRDETKKGRAGEFFTKHGGRSPDDDRIYERKYDGAAAGFKTLDYDRSRRFEKIPREKHYRDGSHYEKDYPSGEKTDREKGRFGETFKRKRHAEDLDRSKRSRDGSERRDSHEKYGSHEKPDRERDRDRSYDGTHGHRAGGSGGRSLDGQGRSGSDGRSIEGGQAPGQHKTMAVGVGAGERVADWRGSDSHRESRSKVAPERRSSETPHNMSQLKVGPDSRGSDAHGPGHGRLPEGSRKTEGRSIDRSYLGQSKAVPEIKAAEVVSGGQSKAVVDATDLDLKALDKSLPQKDDLSSQENRLTKVKLKVGGITHTIHANSTIHAGKQKAAEGSSASTKPAQVHEGGKRRQRLILQENSDDEDDFPPRVERGLQESPKKDHASIFAAECVGKMDVHLSKEDKRSKISDEGTSGKHSFPSNQAVRKSSRIPKKRMLDGECDEDDDEDETPQRKSCRTPKKRLLDGEYDEDDEEDEIPQRKSSRIPKKRMLDGEYDDDDKEDESQHSKKGRRKPRSGHGSEDMYQDDDELEVASGDEDVANSDMELEGRKRTRRRKQEITSSTVDEKKEAPLTARQRAMQSCKELDSEAGASLIEFPEGLPQTVQRKRKEKVSELEQQLKKAEAAQRRKMQVEKAANAIQAEAIKRILGQDSTRKKREDKLRKQRTEMAQEKAASAMMLSSNSVRWIMGPSGTVVSFSEDAGLPSIFSSSPCRYPPPREKCAGPLCNNTYKYRDSKSNLPLCSLQCYRAIHNMAQPVSTC